MQLRRRPTTDHLPTVEDVTAICPSCGPLIAMATEPSINENDAVFALLRLWRDTNHNGVSEQAELFTLRALGLKTLQLDYQTKRKADEYGNGFRYRAKVTDNRDAQVGRWAWDVFLVSVR